MERSVLKENIGKLVGQRNSFLLFSLILSVAVVLLSLLLCFKRERTVIVPTSGASFWIEEGRASDGYVEKMGLFLADLLLNRSPGDVEKKNQIILEHVHPSFYGDFRKLLKQEGERLSKMNESFFFRMENCSVNQGAFVAVGESVLVLGKEGKAASISEKERRKYTLQFRCENGKLLLTSVKKELA